MFVVVNPNGDYLGSDGSYTSNVRRAMVYGRASDAISAMSDEDSFVPFGVSEVQGDVNPSFLHLEARIPREDALRTPVEVRLAADDDDDGGWAYPDDDEDLLDDDEEEEDFDEDFDEDGDYEDDDDGN